MRRPASESPYSRGVIGTLAQSAETKRELFGSAAQLWLILAVIGVMILAMTGMVLYRHHLRMREAADGARKRKPIVDAWEEAGRRARPFPRDDELDVPDEGEPGDRGGA